MPRLVYTSSPSVVYNGKDLAGVDESAPLCTAAPCAYPTSKAAAEKIVAGANGPALATVSLRPHLVWGPGDKNVVPRVLAYSPAGELSTLSIDPAWRGGSVKGLVMTPDGGLLIVHQELKQSATLYRHLKGVTTRFTSLTDGVVVSGESSVDQAPITGESAPVIRESGGDRRQNGNPLRK